MIFPSSPFSIVELFDVNWDFIRSYILAKISERLRRGVNLVEVCPSILSSLRLKFEYTLVCENSKFMVWNNLFSFAQRHRRSCAGQKEKFRNVSMWFLSYHGYRAKSWFTNFGTHVSKDLSPIQEMRRTDFEILKITKHVIVFVAAGILQLY